MLDKKELRRKYLTRRMALPLEEVARLSAEICQRITTSEWFDSAHHILMYMPFRQEVDIRPLMEYAWAQGKTLYLPKSEPKTKTITIYEVGGFNELQPGTYGILEPAAESCRIGQAADVDVVIVPGVVFDRAGYRIGYGGGYYDRFLPQLKPRTLFVGVAFSLQVVDRLTREAFDRQLDVLVTDTESLWFTE